MKPCIALLATLLLAACGASGGLYLPDQGPRHDNNPLRKDARKAEAQPAPQTAPAPAPADSGAAPPPPTTTP